MSDQGKPCLCWSGPPIFHEGHCCLLEDTQDPQLIGPLLPLPCGHDEEGARIVASIARRP